MVWSQSGIRLDMAFFVSPDSITMKKSQTALIILLRFCGITALLAIAAVFMPFQWMDVIHHQMGLGPFPDAPIVSYLSRSVSAFYATMGVFLVALSLDVERYAALIKLWGWLFIVFGTLLLGIDLSADMPTAWTISEGPFGILAGAAMIWLSSHD